MWLSWLATGGLGRGQVALVSGWPAVWSEELVVSGGILSGWLVLGVRGASWMFDWGRSGDRPDGEWLGGWVKGRLGGAKVDCAGRVELV